MQVPEGIVAPGQNHAIDIITTWCFTVTALYKLLTSYSIPRAWGSSLCRQMLFCVRADLREISLSKGHHLIRSSSQRVAFLIAPATMTMLISPLCWYWKCTFVGKYAIWTWWRYQMETFSALLTSCIIKTHVHGFFDTDLHEVNWHFAQGR